MMYHYKEALVREPDMYETVTRPEGNNKGHKTVYADVIGAFDIETSTVFDTDKHPHSFMYIWQYAVDDRVYYGRTWEDFKEFVTILEDRLPAETHLLTYTHNLSFEYTYLSGVFDIPRESVFPTSPRKILRVTIGKLDFRCSYFLSNMSLRKFLETEGVPTQKGEMDYKKVRFPWTELTEEEMSYCEADVRGLVEAIRHRMEKTGDDHYTIPYTSTGYVRREAKAVMRKVNAGKRDPYVYDSYEAYVELRNAFRGGNTHASRFWAAAGAVTDELIYSDDISSSYPYIIMSGRFPASKLRHINDERVRYDGGSVYVDDMIKSGYAVLFTVRLRDVVCHEDEHVPYIPDSKCLELTGATLDNGRVLSANVLTTTITDVDWEIIRRQYDYSDCETFNVWISRYGSLPQEYIDLVRSYFKGKTELKGVDDYLYGRKKALLNALYGLMAQQLLKPEILMSKDGILYEQDPADLKKTYYAEAHKAFLPYSAGVWLTAQARYRLQQAIWLVGDDFLYCDTDSVKHLHEYDFSVLGGDDTAYYDPSGEAHYCGVWERDAVYSEFQSMGAKKYVVRYAEDPVNKKKKWGKLEITIAGVGKVVGSKQLEEEGGINAFKKGLKFKTCGVDAVYNDDDDFELSVDRFPNLVYTEDRSVRVTRNVSLVDGDYTLGLSTGYDDLLNSIRAKRSVIDLSA